MAKILVIDDEEMIRKSIGTALSWQGHEVHLAGDGVEGVDKFEVVHPDLVITDLAMPRKGGLAVISDLRNRNPFIKILVTSGNARLLDDGSLKSAQDLGATRILPKPHRMQTMLNTVSDILN